MCFLRFSEIIFGYWSESMRKITLFLIIPFLIFIDGCDRDVSVEHWCKARMYKLFIEVNDGDTITYRGTVMRFLGVDAPELRNIEHGFYFDQPYGREAKEFVRRELRLARRITFASDGFDYYGRLLVHIFVDGYPLSARIIEEGLGYETVSVYGDNGFPEVSEIILRASKLHPSLPFDNPYIWRRKHRRLSWREEFWGIPERGFRLSGLGDSICLRFLIGMPQVS